MGLLDEAIREHLELKRRHGADAAEIARLEQEALGPARRTPADAAPEAQPSPEPAAVEDQDLFADAPPTAEPSPAERAPVIEDDYVFEGHDEFEEAEPLPDVPPAAEASVPPAAIPPEEEQGTVEFEPSSEEDWVDDWDAGEEPPAVPPASGETAQDEAAEKDKSEDVLEETPEFLQETPEHDRLWFEQKPPRDFEF